MTIAEFKVKIDNIKAVSQDGFIFLKKYQTFWDIFQISYYNCIKNIIQERRYLNVRKFKRENYFL